MRVAMPAESVKLVICDVDGVLTDGRVAIDALGHESKQFSVIDGTGITYLQRSGIEVGFLSGRVSEAVTHRAGEHQQRGQHQGVDVDDPLQLGGRRAQIGADRRDRDVDDGGVHRDDQQTQTTGREDDRLTPWSQRADSFIHTTIVKLQLFPGQCRAQ